MTRLHDALLRENHKVPRYTSYPTAPHFTSSVGSDTVSAWISELADDSSLSLYFHVPYCRKMCWYCGCNTRATRRYSPVATFLDHLFQEIELVGNTISGRGIVSHIHFGGGSPSMLQPDDFTTLMRAVRSTFMVDTKAEIAIELDPREVSEAKVAAYALAGVNRASLGIQDFHADVQAAINRRQPFPTVYDAVKLLRAYGISDINMDLLYGLPHQTTDHMVENIDFAVALDPSRISLFGYAHVPWMKKHMRLIEEDALPGGAERLKQFEAAAAHLAKRGFIPIGLDHFVHPKDPMAQAAKDGTLKRNFQGYTTDGADALIGFGPSAISAYPQGYAQNSPVNKEYFDAVGQGRLAIIKGKTLTTGDKLRRQIIEGLMCYFEFDLQAFADTNRLNRSEFQGARDRIAELEAQGLAVWDAGVIRVPEEARQAVRLVAAAFDEYLTISGARHAQVA